MEKKYINVIIMVFCAIAVIAIYLYDVLWLGTAYDEKLLKVLSALFSFTLIYIRSAKRVQNKNFNMYETAYANIIRNAFADNLRLKKKFLLGIDAYNKEKYQTAIKRLSKLAESGFYKTEIVPVLLFLAMSYKKTGCVDDAAETYKKVLKLAPQNEVANNNIGVIYSERGEFEKMLEHYECAIRSAPDFERAYLNRGQYYLESYQLDEAVSDAKRVLNISNDNKQAVLLLAIAYALQNDEKNKRSYYDKAVELGYNARDIENLIAFYKNGYEKVK